MSIEGGSRGLRLNGSVETCTIFRNRCDTGYFGVLRDEFALERCGGGESSACCGVNLALRRVFPRVGPATGLISESMRVWYFGVLRDEEPLERCGGEESSACCGVNLAFSWVFPRVGPATGLISESMRMWYFGF
jgi:hypothetical protein